MGADWYNPFIIFGCEFVIPPEISYRKFIKKVLPLKDFMTTFSIRGILTSFHSRMEGDIDDNKDLDELAYVVIGFEPSGDFEKMIELRTKLLNFVTDNPIFEEFEIVKVAKYYCGIEWNPCSDSGSDSGSDSDSDSDSVSDSGSDSDEQTDTTDSEYYCLGDDSGSSES
jgi:hypothetical protein